MGSKPNFSTVAKEVIRDAIRSAVCIDDAYSGAYDDADSSPMWKESKTLHESFRRDGKCDLDIYKFTTYEESWQPDYMLANKDLMILDWELSDITKYDDALKILDDALIAGSIPFVLIYTSVQDLNHVAEVLVKKFSRVNGPFRQTLIQQMDLNFQKCSNEPESVDAETWLIDSETDILAYQYQLNKKEEISSRLLKSIKGRFKLIEAVSEPAVRKSIQRAVNQALGYSIDDPFQFLCNNMEEDSSGSISVYPIARIDSTDMAFLIDGTIVLVYHKQNQADGIKPEDLFSRFAQAIVSNPHSYLHILSLELKDKLREAFSKIGQEFSSVNELAFFRHLENYRNIEQGNKLDTKYIHDFLLKSWIGELYQQQLGKEPRLLGFAQYRGAKLGISKIAAETPSNEELAELVRYASYVSTVSPATRTDNKLRFGDLFIVPDSNEFYLCITPHCDCVRPEEKINMNFYWVRGISCDSKEALERAETGQYSFLVVQKEAKAVRWVTKPFTSFVRTNDVRKMSVNFKGKKVQLKSLIILKDNYAQRIANESFGYGYRVGVDLPHISSVDSSDATPSCPVAE